MDNVRSFGLPDDGEDDRKNRGVPSENRLASVMADTLTEGLPEEVFKGQK